MTCTILSMLSQTDLLISQIKRERENIIKDCPRVGPEVSQINERSKELSIKLIGAFEKLYQAIEYALFLAKEELSRKKHQSLTNILGYDRQIREILKEQRQFKLADIFNE